MALEDYIKNIGRSSNGRTMDSGSIYLGSNPSLPARKSDIIKIWRKNFGSKEINIGGAGLQFLGKDGWCF